jgi:hypothetical protein
MIYERVKFLIANIENLQSSASIKIILVKTVFDHTIYIWL